MKKFDSAKNTYEDLEIPEELNEVVQNAIRKTPRKKKGNIYKISFSLATAAVLALTVGLNTSESFAMEAQQLPIIGSIAKVLTIRSYENEDEDKKVEVEIPAVVEEIQGDTAVTNKIVDVNAQIQRISDEYVIEAQKRADEYKQAFLETGGTEEEWKEHDIQIKVDYEIKSETDRYLSFVLYGTESWTGAYAEAHYYNLDLQTGEPVTLKGILGEDYIQIANESISKQMEERLAADKDLTYFDESMDGFQTITDDTKFYLNKEGKPVIVFAKYEIAPGAFGAQEFEIKP